MLAEVFLVYGVGSKRKILSEFRDLKLKSYCTLTIDGFREDVSIRSILSIIIESLKLANCEQKRRSVVEWATDIARKIHSEKKQLIILLNNIDGTNLRDSLTQNALLALAESEAVSLVATIDHVNATALWNTRQLSSFNWLYMRIDTFAVPSVELLAGQSRALGLNSKTSQGAHSLTSLDILWQSLATNSREIFRIFFSLFFLKNEPLLFWDLFNVAKDNFIVSSDTALRQQLVEFSDHRILRMKRSDSGDDELVGLLDKSLVEKFLTEKGLSFDID
uniref:Origin recognition complex subunit 2 n=1 Tax=Heterorhabditis bacteriophora TaxID=37862 RepID=A0A1I7WV14_HETBA